MNLPSSLITRLLRFAYSRVKKKTDVYRLFHIVVKNVIKTSIQSFVDKLLQPIAQQQKSYLKDTTAFINFIKK